MSEENLVCLNCENKTFEIKVDIEAKNLRIMCTSCKCEISPLNPDESVKEFMKFWVIGMFQEKKTMKIEQQNNDI